SIAVYLRRGTTARSLVAGLYGDRRGQPGRLLSTGSAGVRGGSRWVTVALPAAGVTRGRAYWIAVLGRGGRLLLDLSGQCARASGSGGAAGALPRAWRGIAQPAGCRMSAYVRGVAKGRSSGPVGTTANATGSGHGGGSTGHTTGG